MFFNRTKSVKVKKHKVTCKHMLVLLHNSLFKHTTILLQYNLFFRNIYLWNWWTCNGLKRGQMMMSSTLPPCVCVCARAPSISWVLNIQMRVLFIKKTHKPGTAVTCDQWNVPLSCMHTVYFKGGSSWWCMMMTLMHEDGDNAWESKDLRIRTIYWHRIKYSQLCLN